MMKKVTMIFVTLLMVTAIHAQEKKAKSPQQTAKGKISGANITIDYCSPSVNGRTVWGDLVPYGKVWRAGANDATTFQTDKPIMIEGKELPAGKYSFFVIPENDAATVIFNKEHKQWGANKYDETKDQLRVKVKPVKSAVVHERLMYAINKNNVTLSWDKWDIPMKIK